MWNVLANGGITALFSDKPDSPAFHACAVWATNECTLVLVLRHDPNLTARKMMGTDWAAVACGVNWKY
jgi:hypothetical protein